MWITRNCMVVLHCITTKGVVKLERDPYLYVTPNYRLLRKKRIDVIYNEGRI